MRLKLLPILFLLLFFLACTNCALFKAYAFSPESAIDRKVSDAVVRLETYGGRGGCSGFHVGGNQIITAAHCIPDSAVIIFTFEPKPLALPPSELVVKHRDSTKYPATLVRLDKSLDLALLTVVKFKGPALDLAYEWLMPRLGSDAIVLGYPGYFNRNFTFEVMKYKGLVKIPVDPEDKTKGNKTFVVTTKGLAPGYSGSPVISMETGQVIGVAHAIVPKMLFLSPYNPIHIHDDYGISIPGYLARDFLQDEK